MDPEKVDRASCEQHDCLHRSYGTAMTAHCGVCYDQIFNYRRVLKKEDIQDALKGVGVRC